MNMAGLKGILGFFLVNSLIIIFLVLDVIWNFKSIFCVFETKMDLSALAFAPSDEKHHCLHVNLSSGAWWGETWFVPICSVMFKLNM